MVRPHSTHCVRRKKQVIVTGPIQAVGRRKRFWNIGSAIWKPWRCLEFYGWSVCEGELIGPHRIGRGKVLRRKGKPVHQHAARNQSEKSFHDMKEIYRLG